MMWLQTCALPKVCCMGCCQVERHLNVASLLQAVDSLREMERNPRELADHMQQT